MSQEDIEKKFTNIKIKKDHKFPDIIDFDFAGRGFGNASIYYGFYYIRNDNAEKALINPSKKELMTPGILEKETPTTL